VDDDLASLKIPRHVAVIMDGNGRWAQERGLSRLEGHYAGRKAIHRVVEACRKFGIEVLSVYAFSAENWRRPTKEIEGLFQLIETALAEELEDLCRDEVRFVPSGRLGELPESLQRTLEKARIATAENEGLILNLLVNYGGRAEIVDAARKLVKEAKAGQLDPEAIGEELFSQYLYAPELPDPDLVIRPGGEQRLSNFLVWETAYAELVTMEVLWPDFGEEHLLEAIREYGRRQRRFGSLVQSDHSAQ